MTPPGNKVFGYLLLLLLLLASGQDLIAETLSDKAEINLVTPADVYLELNRVREKIRVLGRFMGVREPDALGIVVSNVAPHHVYFQVRTLARKANRLSFELVRDNREPPNFPPGDIGPAEVKGLVLEALKSLSVICQEMGITATTPKLIVDPAITPSAVFEATINANRYINALLERRFSSAEVYQVVNLAIGYASQQLAQYPGIERIPKRPAFEKNKQPLDVYFRLHNCLLLINKIFKARRFEVLTIDISKINPKNITPSDVFDLASLIVASLDYMHKKTNQDTSPKETYYPGRKFPSDVYQQAGILEKQLTILMSQTSTKAMNAFKMSQDK